MPRAVQAVLDQTGAVTNPILATQGGFESEMDNGIMYPHAETAKAFFS